MCVVPAIVPSSAQSACAIIARLPRLSQNSRGATAMIPAAGQDGAPPSVLRCRQQPRQFAREIDSKQITRHGNFTELASCEDYNFAGSEDHCSGDLTG